MEITDEDMRHLIAAAQNEPLRNDLVAISKNEYTNEQKYEQVWQLLRRSEWEYDVWRIFVSK